MKKFIRIITILLMLGLLAIALAACKASPQQDEIVEEAPLEAQPAYLAEKALEYFYEVSKIPRGTDNEQAISDYLVAFAQENGLEAVQDSARNVLITKPGSTGREDEPPVILQAHMDMVCEKNADSDHDFLTDPIIPNVEGDWIMADGTTLGADNGCGVAIIMAVLAAENLSHPPIEALITANEEGGEGSGVSAFDVAQLKGERLINLDSEEDGALTVSCVGAAYHHAIIHEEYETIPDGSVVYDLTVKGLLGGHSAVDIDKGRANAIILMARVLDALDDAKIYLSFIGINGGTGLNAIPRECLAGISFAESDFEKVQSVVAQMETQFRMEYADENITIEMENVGTTFLIAVAHGLPEGDSVVIYMPESTAESYPDDIVTQIETELRTEHHDENITVTPEKIVPIGVNRDSLRKVIDVILTTPNGVQAMSADFEGVVQTSSSIGTISAKYDPFGDKGKVDIRIDKMIRGFTTEDMASLITEMSRKATAAGASDNQTGSPYSPWKYKKDSPLRDAMVAVYTDMYGKAPIVTGIHGGVECASFAEKMPDCDLIAIGPTIENPHSPSERMSLSSFNRTCDYLAKVLEKL